MPFVTSAEKARSERKAIDVLGQEYFLSPYVGSAPKRGQYVPGNEKNDDGLPQGFLVEQPPNSVTRPHFRPSLRFTKFVLGAAVVLFSSDFALFSSIPKSRLLYHGD